MNAWEYRAKWYGEDEGTARERAGEEAGAGPRASRQVIKDAAHEAA